MPREACRVSCHLPDLIGFPELLGSSKGRNQKLFRPIGFSQYKSWHGLIQTSFKRNNNNIKFPPTTMALVLFGWVVTPPVSCHKRTTNLQIDTVFLRMFFLVFLFGLDISVAPVLQGHEAYLNTDFYNLTGRVPCLHTGNCHRADLIYVLSRWQSKNSSHNYDFLSYLGERV